MSIKAKLPLFLAAILLSGFSLTAIGQVEEPLPPTDDGVVNASERIPWSITLSETASGYNKSIEVLRFPEDFPEESYMAVIETVSYEVKVPDGQHVNVRFVAEGGDIGPFTVFMPGASPWPGSSSEIYADTVQMRVYAGGGDFDGVAIKAFLQRDSNGGNAEFTVSFMGYFLPQDSTSLLP